jgi:hypothetical protein
LRYRTAKSRSAGPAAAWRRGPCWPALAFDVVEHQIDLKYTVDLDE